MRVPQANRRIRARESAQPRDDRPSRCPQNLDVVGAHRAECRCRGGGEPHDGPSPVPAGSFANPSRTTIRNRARGPAPGAMRTATRAAGVPIRHKGPVRRCPGRTRLTRPDQPHRCQRLAAERWPLAGDRYRARAESLSPHRSRRVRWYEASRRTFRPISRAQFLRVRRNPMGWVGQLEWSADWSRVAHAWAGRAADWSGQAN